MKMDVQKLKAALEAYEADHGTVVVRSHETINCVGCYTGGTCKGTCQNH